MCVKLDSEIEFIIITYRLNKFPQYFPSWDFEKKEKKKKKENLNVKVAISTTVAGTWP